MFRREQSNARFTTTAIPVTFIRQGDRHGATHEIPDTVGGPGLDHVYFLRGSR